MEKSSQEGSVASSSNYQEGVDEKISSNPGTGQLGRKETKVVYALRRTMVALLIVACAATAASLYVVTSKSESDAFVRAFESAAEGMTTSFIGDTKAKFVAIYQASFTVTTISHLKESARNISVPFFESLTLPTLADARIRSISWSPLLPNEGERAYWEAFARQEKDSPLFFSNEKPNPTCYVCGERMTVAHPEQEVGFPGAGFFNCGAAAKDALAGAINPTYCSLMKEDILRDCGCKQLIADDLLPEIEDEGRTIEAGIFKLDEHRVAVDQNGEGPFSPIWQVAPLNGNENTRMYDQMSDPVRKRALEAMIESKLPVMSATYTGFDYVADHKDGPGAIAYYPVFENTAAGTVIGAIGAEFSWRNYFSFQFPDQSEGIIVVVKNTCGQTMTFRIENLQMIFLGDSDLHDTTYDDMMQETLYETFVEYQNGISYSAVESTASFHVPIGCAYKVQVYPSQDIESVYKTNMPGYLTGLVVVIFVFVSSTFLAYDCFVAKRQTIVMDSAERANTIVSSLFPAVVRDRLFATAISAPSSSASDNAAVKSRGVSKTNGPVALPVGIIPSSLGRLKGFLDNINNEENTESADIATEPIADKFEDTTVYFADLVGFTKWSSTRDPVAVFKLLESLYGIFDRIAKAREVYKIETIGDCYMAVAGLPEPNKHHAVAMAKFAANCRKEMALCTARMEETLGPGTTELRMRIGLHSGAVTAGVLRGDRSRFQLFGDTVNTSSRMESTGAADKIQCSQATADLLIAAGKARWLTPREDLVEAKGKGSMQTYWVNPVSRASSSACSADLTSSSFTDISLEAEHNGNPGFENCVHSERTSNAEH